MTTEWQAHPHDDSDQLMRHLKQFTQSAIDQYVQEQRLRGLENASPAQQEELGVRLQQRVGLAEDSASLAVIRQVMERKEAHGVRYTADENMRQEHALDTLRGKDGPNYMREAREESFARQVAEPALETFAAKHNVAIAQLTEDQVQQLGKEISKRHQIPLEIATTQTSYIQMEYEQKAYQRELSLRGEAGLNIRREAHVEVYDRLARAVGSEYAAEFGVTKDQGNVASFSHRPTGEQIHLDSKGNFYDLAEGQPPKAVGRDEVLERFQKIPDSILKTEAPDHRRQWEPVEKAFGYRGADQLEHHSQRGDISVYRDAGNEQDRFVGLDSKGRFYRVDNQDSYKPEARISRDEALQELGGRAHFYTPVEPTPTHKDWSRLEQAVGQENALQFTFKGETSGIQSYQHDQTGNHVRLNPAGQFHNAEHQPIAREIALAHALPPQPISSSQAVPLASEPDLPKISVPEQSLSM